jgi:hypothetical protein
MRLGKPNLLWSIIECFLFSYKHQLVQEIFEGCKVVHDSGWPWCGGGARNYHPDKLL